MDATELLTCLVSQGFNLVPLPGDKLEVRPASKLTDDLRQALRQHKAELLALLTQQPTPWTCPHCGGQVQLEPAEEEHAPTRFWACPACGTWGATREGAPRPTVWVSPGGV